MTEANARENAMQLYLYVIFRQNILTDLCDFRCHVTSHNGIVMCIYV